MNLDKGIFEQLVQQSPEGICVIDATGHYVFCNEGFCKITGYHFLELIGQPVLKFVEPAFRDQILNLLENARATDSGELNFEKPFVNKNGQVIWLKVISSFIKRMDKTYQVSFYRNENDYKNQKAELKASNERISRYSYITSHHLRHPIANIQGLINLLDTENLANPENLLMINYLKQSSEQLNEVVHQLNQTLNSEKLRSEVQFFRNKRNAALIMLIDDDPINQYITQNVINRIDDSIHVLLFGNPKQALKYLETGKDLPEMIFLDLSMVWMTEWDFLREAGKLKIPEIPAFVFKNFVDHLDHSNSVELTNFKGFVMKPITMEKLSPILIKK